MITRGKKYWVDEGINIMRGIGGGVIVALPLVYTMEMWFIGMYISPLHIILFLIFGVAISFALNHASGFRLQHDIWSDIHAALVAVGIAAVLSTVLLILIGSIGTMTSWHAALGMIIMESVPISIGISIANTQFGGRSRSEERARRPDEDPEIRKAKQDILDIGITIAGATVFVYNVAPTEEIMLIASRTTGWQWAGLVIISVLITYGMVFVADFAGHKCRKGMEGFIQRPVPETLIAYVFSVITGLVLLYLLGRTEILSSISFLTANAAVVGLPASIGGAAGRIIV